MTGSALANQPDPTNLAMVAVYPTAEQAQDIAVEGGQDAETMHCTLVFLGEADELDLAAAERAVAAAAKTSAPLSGKISGVALFGKTADGYPQVAIPSAKGLATLRTRVVEALAAEGIKSASEWDWMPHITLAYTAEPAYADMSVLEKPVSFDSLSLAVANDRTDFDLTGQEALRTRTSVFSRAQQRRAELLLAEAKSL